MKKISLLIFALLILAACVRTAGERLVPYVDTGIGTGGHGHVFVGANVPFGLVQLGPTSIPQEWDWTSGYHADDSTVIGFSHTHLSGTGIGDLFDITVMPVTGEVKYARGTEDDPISGLWSYADRTKEVSMPGYYSVPLTRYGITAELTATTRTGFHRYTFPRTDDAAIIFDLENGGCWDKATDTFMEKVSDTAIRGYRRSTGWADNQRLYFYAEFSHPFTSFGIITKPDGGGVELPLYARAGFGKLKAGEQILLKVALSPVSMEGAAANMAAELGGWDFEATAEAASDAWESELSKIRIETADETAKKIFYTALYHSMIAPATFCDVSGDYRGADGQVYKNPGHSTYTIFSLWDTYRAAMPLYSIFQPEKYGEFIRTMLNIYKEQGKLPVWHLHGCETDCMVGNPGIPPVADAIVKGFDIDKGLAFEAMKQSALRPDRGQDFRMEYGYIPYDLFNESVAYDLEYALADGAIAEAAKILLGEGVDCRDDMEYFMNRSRSYKHLFDPELTFIRGRDSKGKFRMEYSPFASTHRADDYCEGNGWQYTWLVPHDVEGLIGCFGGRDAFTSKLDSLFMVSSEIEGDASSPDISGLIGQYAHGNEPSHHIIYLYAMAGRPWKTADRVREVLATMYHAEPDGLAGNEDVGQMSSWYILSSLGFYQVEPGSGRYWFGSPLFDKAAVEVEGGIFTIVANNNSADNRYIRSIRLNGREHTKGYIEHKDIAAGGELVIEMSPEPASWQTENQKTY